MDFEQFKKKLGDSMSPDKAYKLYMQTKILILEEYVKAILQVDEEKWTETENKILGIIIDKHRDK